MTLTVRDLASRYGVTPGAIRRQFRRHGVRPVAANPHGVPLYGDDATAMLDARSCGRDAPGKRGRKPKGVRRGA